jgi:hypothetical protein
MKKTILLGMLLCTAALVSCKKTVEEKARDLLMEAITDGIWSVTGYMQDTTEIGHEFQGYDFIFYTDQSMVVAKGSDTLTGTWKGDIYARSIKSECNSADDPVKKINGEWIIKESNWHYVKAEMKTATGMNTLEMKKRNE